ncbi:hypothetical protein [Chitinimonas sp.]|uniref:hypothetical protein n=1 Tax=Chitinimonas sp. TaxID=1934313 RepID=UPI002F930F57
MIEIRYQAQSLPLRDGVFQAVVLHQRQVDGRTDTLSQVLAGTFGSEKAAEDAAEQVIAKITPVPR